MQGPDDMLIDDWEAKAKHVSVGGTLQSAEPRFSRCRNRRARQRARIFVPLATLQDLSGSRDKASIFFMKCTRPDHTAGRDGRDEGHFSGVSDSSAEGFLDSDELGESSGARCLHQRHDRAGGVDRIPRDSALDVHHGDRTHARHRRSEIHGAPKGYIIRALLASRLSFA